MISKETLDRVILEHEEKDTTYANCERLAWLYIVRDHIAGQTQKQAVPLDISGDSGFLKAVNGRDSVKVFAVMDELMSVLQVINPKLYDGVMRKIDDL